MNFCKNCDHYHKPKLFGCQYHMCSRDGCVNEITGEPEGFCQTQRLHEHLCGQEAKYFKPKSNTKNKLK